LIISGTQTRTSLISQLSAGRRLKEKVLRGNHKAAAFCLKPKKKYIKKKLKGCCRCPS